MEARIITNRQMWNEFVAGAEQCNVTQSYEWGQLLKALNDEVLYVGVVDDQGKMCAALLLLVSRVSVSKSVYFYAPRGPILDDPDSPVMAVLLNYVKALAHKYHAFMLKIEPGVADNDPKWLSALHRRGFVANPEALHLRHEWVLDVRPDEQALLAAMRKTWRYSIRLASRKDVTVRRGESLADIDTFYRILQTTSQRDTFMIYDKSFYEKLVELYGQSQNVALFIAEYEGQALGAALLVKMGHWCWYMYGASSNEHRDRMPNHLLQWTAIRWAKEQGCWYYNFRGIPDVLEESQPMWGVYLFKSGFGGSAMRSLETHDLPYNPMLYRLYRSWLDGRSWLKDLRAKRHNPQIEAEKPEKQSDSAPTETEKPSKGATAQANTEPKQARQKERTEKSPTRGANSSLTNPIHGEGNTKAPPQPQPSLTQPTRVQSKDKQRIDANLSQENIQVPPQLQPSLALPSGPQAMDEQPALQPTHENKSIHAESQSQPAVEQRSEEEQSAQIEVQPEPIQAQPGGEGGEIEDPKEHIETTNELEHTELQPEPVTHSTSENPEEHLETSEEFAQEKVQAEPLQADSKSPENLKEHLETTDENASLEPEVHPALNEQVQEELEDQDDPLNEETQKLPRIQIAQKHASARRPAEQKDV